MKDSKMVSESQGDSKHKSPPTLKEVQEFVKRDVGVCIAMLSAVHNDKPTMDALAEYLHGRYMNALHQEELKAQGNLNLS